MKTSTSVDLKKTRVFMLNPIQKSKQVPEDKFSLRRVFYTFVRTAYAISDKTKLVTVDATAFLSSFKRLNDPLTTVLGMG